MMTLLNQHVIISTECVKRSWERSNLISELTSPHTNNRPYKLLEITTDEVEGMCANMFNLIDNEGTNCVIMSDRARRTYCPAKLNELNTHYKVIVANIDMIEHVGGGSARCMLAEKF